MVSFPSVKYLTSEKISNILNTSGELIKLFEYLGVFLQQILLSFQI